MCQAERRARQAVSGNHATKPTHFRQHSRFAIPALRPADNRPAEDLLTTTVNTPAMPSRASQPEKMPALSGVSWHSWQSWRGFPCPTPLPAPPAVGPHRGGRPGNAGPQRQRWGGGGGQCANPLSSQPPRTQQQPSQSNPWGRTLLDPPGTGTEFKFKRPLTGLDVWGLKRRLWVPGTVHFLFKYDPLFD